MHRQYLSLIALAAAAAISSGTAAQAANKTWSGSNASGNWSLGGAGGNWSAAAAPVAADALIFDGSNHLTDNNNDLTADLATGTITFASTAGAFTLTGNRITLGGTLTNGSANLQTINLDMILNGNRSLTATSGDITIGGTISEDASSRTLTIAGSGHTVTLNGTNLYSGVTTISTGATLNTNNLADIGSASGIGKGDATSTATNQASLVINNSTLKYSGGTVSTSRLFTVGTTGGTIDSSGSGALTFSNTGALLSSTNAGRALILTGSTGGTLDPTWDNALGVGANTLTKNGAGAWILAGNNSYTGTTTVNLGMLTLNGTNASATYTVAGGTLNTGSSERIADAATINVTGGTFDLQGFTETIGQISTLTNATITGSSGNKLILSAAANTTTATGTNSVSTNVQLDTGTALLRTFSVTSASDTLTLSGNLTEGSAAAALSKSGAGTLILSGTNSYTGGTTATAGTLQFSAGSLGATGGIVIGSASLRYASGNTADISSRLTISGTVSPIIDIGTNNEAWANQVTVSTTNSNITFIGNSGKIFTFSGSTNVLSVADSVTLDTIEVDVNKTSTGTLNASSINLQNRAILKLLGTTGDQISVGSVINMNATGGGGTFDLNGKSEDFRALTGTTGTVTSSVAGNVTLSIVANAPTNFGGTIQDGSGVVAVLFNNNSKTLSGNNSYSGGTTLQGGTLMLGSNTALGTGALNVSGSGVPITSNSDTARVLANNISITNGASFGSGTVGTNGNLTFGAITSTAGTLTINNAQTTFASLTGAGVLKAGSGALIVTGNYTASGITTLSSSLLGIGGTPTFNNAIQMNGGVLGLNGTFSKSLGALTTNLTWLNAVNGGFAAYGGDLNVLLNNSNVTPLVWNGTNTGTARFVSSGSTLLLSHSLATGTVDFQNSIDLNAAGAAQQTVQVDDGAAAIDAKLSGAQRWRAYQDGAGTLQITNAGNTYAGGTTINAGKVIVNSTLGTGNVTVAAGAVLDLESLGAISDLATLNLATRDGSGTDLAVLNFSGNETVGTLILGGTTFTSGTFNATSNPDFFSGSGSITMAPEPASLSLIGLAATSVLARRRRKHC